MKRVERQVRKGNLARVTFGTVIKRKGEMETLLEVVNVEHD